jgi:hypothetical protein
MELPKTRLVLNSAVIFSNNLLRKCCLFVDSERTWRRKKKNNNLISFENERFNEIEKEDKDYQKVYKNQFGDEELKKW